MMHRTHEREPQPVDALIELYVEWRDECSAVHLSYERWCQASSDDRAAAFSAYRAALDREERASNVYAALIRRSTLAAT